MNEFSHRRNRPIFNKKFLGVIRKRHSPSLEKSIAALAKSGLIAEAAAVAIKKQFDNGVPAVWMENHIIYKIHPDGKREEIGKDTKPRHKTNKKSYTLQIK